MENIGKTEDIEQFKNDVDNWVKELRSDILKTKEFNEILEENVGNTQHNYEITKSLQAEIEDLKQEVRLLKISQIALLRNERKG